MSRKYLLIVYFYIKIRFKIIIYLQGKTKIVNAMYSATYYNKYTILNINKSLDLKIGGPRFNSHTRQNAMHQYNVLFEK